MNDKPTVFVLMPFDEAFKPVYLELIKKPLEAAGFHVERADSLFNQQQILKDIVKGIADATLIVADVTGLNENVLYELGLAHALGKRVIMITQSIEELPFDLRAYKANEYSMLFTEATKLATLMADIGSAVLSGEADFSNPVQDFAPYAMSGASQVSQTPGSQASAGRREAESSGSRQLPQSDEDDEDEPGLLEWVATVLDKTTIMRSVSEEIAEHTRDIGVRLEQRTEKLTRASDQLGDRAMGAQLVIAREAAGDLNNYCDAIAPLSDELNHALEDVSAGVNAIARMGALDDDSDAEAAEGLIDVLREVEAGLGTGRAGVQSFASVMLDVPNMERTFTRAGKRTAATVQVIADRMETAESEFSRARGLLRERIDAYRAASA